MKWDNGNPQHDPTQGFQLKGPYSGYTLSLTLCKNSVIAGRIGRKISHTICTAWVTVGENGIKNTGMGLFAATRFQENHILTIYFAPKKYKTPPTKDKFTAFKYRHLHTIPIMANDQAIYYMGAHFINDATWVCEPIQVKNLEHSDNYYWDLFLIMSKSLIIIGEEFFWVVMTPELNNSSDDYY